MIKRGYVYRFLAFALLLFPLQAAQSAPPGEEQVWELISDNKCGEARRLVQDSEHAQEFVASAGGKSLYAKCLCCSPATELSADDIANAKGHLEAARRDFDPLSDSMGRWLDDAGRQCDEKQASLDEQEALDDRALLGERVAGSRVRSKYAGKMMSGCAGGNLSPELVPGGKSQDHPKWHYVAPRPGTDGNEVLPSREYVDQLAASYVGGSPKVAVCAPFIALSSEQDPNEICKAAHRFTDYFVKKFRARRPPVWLALMHYPQQGKQLYEHASGTSGDINCKSVLGYFDWRHQAIVYRAPPGYFGTFLHELTHALLFWDVPLAPRWFDEGFAALHENTDAGFQGLSNPWRDKVLKRARIRKVDLATLEKESISPSLFEFEAYPVGATVAREYLRNVQRCGDLAGLYGAVKARSRRKEFLNEHHTKPHRRPKAETVNAWKDLANRYSKRDAAAGDCL